MAGLTFFFSKHVAGVNAGGSWANSASSQFLRTGGGWTGLTSSVQAAIQPVIKKTIITDQYSTGNYHESSEKLFLLGKGEIAVAGSFGIEESAKLGLGPNKNQIYLNVQAYGTTTSWYQQVGSQAILRDSYSNSYQYCMMPNGNIHVVTGSANIKPAFCL